MIIKFGKLLINTHFYTSKILFQTRCLSVEKKNDYKLSKKLMEQLVQMFKVL